MSRDRIRQALQTRLPDLLAVCAFGGRIQGTAGPDSDRDLAVRVAGHVNVLTWFDWAGCPVDLLDLHAASTVMQRRGTVDSR